MFETALTQGGKGFSMFFFLIHRAGGCRKPWCKNGGLGITGRCPSKIFLFPFIKHAVLNDKTAHTKGCLENRCEQCERFLDNLRRSSTCSSLLAVELTMVFNALHINSYVFSEECK